MIHGLAHGQFIDDARYWPIFARAEALDVPIYLHPSMPHEAVIDAYYKEYAKDFPVLLRAAWGFTVETATLAIRLVLSGVFDKHPKLKFILGHLGEGLPFLLWRINNGARAAGTEAGRVPRHFQRAFLRDDQRLLLRSGAAAVRAGARASTASCSRSTIRSRRTRRVRPGSRACRCATRTRPRSRAATQSGCCGCEFRRAKSLRIFAVLSANFRRIFAVPLAASQPPCHVRWDDECGIGPC